MSLAVLPHAGPGLFDVPPASWAFIGLGLLASLLILLTPLWWERLLTGVCVKWCEDCRGKKQEPVQKDVLQPGDVPAEPFSDPPSASSPEHMAFGPHFESDV